MADYSEDIQTAFELIQEAGGPVQFKRTAFAQNPITQAVTSNRKSTWDTIAAALPTGNTKLFKPGELVTRDIVDVYTAALGAPFAPTIGDTVLVNGKTRKIIKVYELAPAGDPILWIFYAESG